MSCPEFRTTIHSIPKVLHGQVGIVELDGGIVKKELRSSSALLGDLKETLRHQNLDAAVSRVVTAEEGSK